ncbi:MAG: hypothetical protein K2K93_01335, partial [Muribaculaceae bacterium]|nr:hypothetical protein [Muribaculaceae bacterium]
MFLLLRVWQGCSRTERVPENEEEDIYLLVGEPCAEGDYLTAISRADSLLAAPREMSDSLRAFIMIDRDVSICEYGHLDWGKAYADTIIEFGKSRGIALAVMQGLQNRGIVSRRQGNYDKAISDYKEGLELAVKENDTEMVQVFSEMLAIACGENRLYEEALSFAHRSLEIADETEDESGVLNAVSTIGGIMVKKGDYEGAIKALQPYHDRAMAGKTLMRVKYLTPLLQSYLQLDSLGKVHETLQETYQALEGTPRNTQAYLVAVNAEAGLAGKEGRYADQWRWYQLADSIGGMGTSPEILYGQRAQCLANMGRFSEAYEMERKAFAALDSVRTASTDTNLQELSVKYATLDKENTIMQLKAQRLLWSLIALSCVLVVAVGVFILIFMRRRALRRIEKERQEEYIRGLEEERARMARELHDDVAGSLVGLQWQLPTMSEEEAEKSIGEITRRVRTLSHELMPPIFREHNLTEMLLDYVAKINSQPHGKHVTLVDEGSFPWDQVSPEERLELYRIIQESVGNALRHGSGGDIRIELSGAPDRGGVLTITNFISEDYAPKIGDGAGLR